MLVTGGAGFIGSHLVDSLLDCGARVRVLDNLATGQKVNLSHCFEHIEFLEGDLRDRDMCARACEGIAFVFHQAALGSVPRSMKEPATTIAVNVSGTGNLFEAARNARVRRVIYASSSSVYGDRAKLPNREGEEGVPLSPYAASKVMNEELAAVFGRCFAMEMIGLRYFNVYGPRQDPEGPYAAVVPRFFRACARREPPVIYGDGEQSRDFTFVADAVRANLLACAAPKSALGRAYNVSGGKRTPIKELAEVVRAVFGGGAPARFEEPRPGEVRHSQADLSLSGEAIGYAPSFDLSAGIAAYRRDYQEETEDSLTDPRGAASSAQASKPASIHRGDLR